MHDIMYEMVREIMHGIIHELLHEMMHEMMHETMHEIMRNFISGRIPISFRVRVYIRFPKAMRRVPVVYTFCCASD